MSKRPEIKKYVIPAKRNNPENNYNETEYAEDNYANEVTNHRQAYSSRNPVSRRISINKREYAKDDYTNEDASRQAYSSRNSASCRDRRQVINSSSSSSPNPRSVSGESCKDDSSDYEESCREETSDEEIKGGMNKNSLADLLNKKPRAKPSNKNHNIKADIYRTNTKVSNRMGYEGYSSAKQDERREATSDEEITVGMNKNNLDDHLNENPGEKPSNKNHDIKADNYRTNTKVPNRMRHEEYSNAKHDANQLQSSDSSETEPVRGLFGNYGDSSISDIDASSCRYRRKERVLTSTPYSDIVEQKVLDAAKYVSEESGTESTLLDENYVSETSINTNTSKPENNFEKHHDPSFILDEPKGNSEIFGNNFIPAPVEPVFALPPIHRLPAPVPSIQGVTVLNYISPRKIVQRSGELKHPRPLLPLQYPPPLHRQNYHLHSDYTSPTLFIHSNPPIRPPVPRFVSSPCLQPAPVANLPPAFSRPTVMDQRINPPSSFRAASNLQYLQQRTLNARGAESHNRKDSGFRAPSVARQQQVNGSHQMRNPNQCETTQRRLPYTYSLRNKVIFDEDLWPDD